MSQPHHRSRRVPLGRVRALCAALLALLGCRGDERAATPAGQSAALAATPREQQLVVFAAASLRDVFSELGARFEQTHPGVRVRFNFAGSQQLRTQIEHGAAADVFASADPRHMQALAAIGKAGTAVVFTRNEPVLVVASEVAATIRELRDLPNASSVVLGAPEVPIGRYTSLILDRASSEFGPGFRARVEAKVASRELNVKQVLSKVRLGEAQAGLVYRSDVHGSPDLLAIAIPPQLNVIAQYPIAPITGAKYPSLAAAWIELVLSDIGQRALERAGFLSSRAQRDANDSAAPIQPAAAP